MRLLFCLFSLLTISLSASASSEWLYYKEYPWVYDYHTKDWLYLSGAGGEIYAYRNSTNAWEVFEAQKTWEEKYEEWIQNPEPYGGLSVLQQIKDAKDSGATKLDLRGRNISDLTPLAGLTNLEWLILEKNNISDLTPLASLTNLTRLFLDKNNISDITSLAGLTNLEQLDFKFNNISDLSPLTELTNLYSLGIQNNNVSDLSPLASLTNLKSFFAPYNDIDLATLNGLTHLENLELKGNDLSDITPLAGLTNLTTLELGSNNISDLSPLTGLTNLTGTFGLNLRANNISNLSPLAELTNLTWIDLGYNSVNDLTPLAGLTNLTELYLNENPITDSQKAMLEEALPNTNIIWPDVIIDDSQETEKTWDELYEEWVQNPEPYGGLEVLQKIKDAKVSGATEFVDHPFAVYGIGISDISPFEGLNRFERLSLGINNISDLTPLSSLTNLRFLNLEENNISDLSPLVNLTQLVQLFLDDQDTPISLSQKAMLEEALPNTEIIWD